MKYFKLMVSWCPRKRANNKLLIVVPGAMPSNSLTMWLYTLCVGPGSLMIYLNLQQLVWLSARCNRSLLLNGEGSILWGTWIYVRVRHIVNILHWDICWLLLRVAHGWWFDAGLFHLINFYSMPRCTKIRTGLYIINSPVLLHFAP